MKKLEDVIIPIDDGLLMKIEDCIRKLYRHNCDHSLQELLIEIAIRYDKYYHDEFQNKLERALTEK